MKETDEEYIYGMLRQNSDFFYRSGNPKNHEIQHDLDGAHFMGPRPITRTPI